MYRSMSAASAVIVTRNGGGGVAGVMLTRTLARGVPVKTHTASRVVAMYSSRFRRVARPALRLAPVETTST